MHAIWFSDDSNAKRYLHPNDLVGPAAGDPRALRSFFSGQQPWQSIEASRPAMTLLDLTAFTA